MLPRRHYEAEWVQHTYVQCMIHLPTGTANGPNTDQYNATISHGTSTCIDEAMSRGTGSHELTLSCREERSSSTTHWGVS